MREVLEGAFAPEVATEVMFAALQARGEMPETADDVLNFCEQELAAQVAEVIGDDVRDVILERLERVLVRNDWSGSDIPIDVDVEPPETLVMPTVWKSPVAVLIVASDDMLARLISASLGPARVSPTTVDGEESLRKQAFSLAPLLVLIDARVAPPAMPRGALAACLRQLPDGVHSVVWGGETAFGSGLAVALEAAGVADASSVRSEDGLNTMLDLIRARYADE